MPNSPVHRHSSLCLCGLQEVVGFMIAAPACGAEPFTPGTVFCEEQAFHPAFDQCSSQELKSKGGTEVAPNTQFVSNLLKRSHGRWSDLLAATHLAGAAVWKAKLWAQIIWFMCIWWRIWHQYFNKSSAIAISQVDEDERMIFECEEVLCHLFLALTANLVIKLCDRLVIVSLTFGSQTHKLVNQIIRVYYVPCSSIFYRHVLHGRIETSEKKKNKKSNSRFSNRESSFPCPVSAGRGSQPAATLKDKEVWLMDGWMNAGKQTRLTLPAKAI